MPSAPVARGRLDAHPATWLALRLLRSPLQRVSLALVAVCSFLAGLTFVGLFAVPGVIAEQSATTFRHQVRHEPAPTGVYAWTHVTGWRDKHVITETVVAVAPGARIPAASIPPGVQGILRTGDIWVSPALRRLAHRDRALAAAYPADRLRALAPDVLETSRTLRAVRVVDPAEFRGRPETVGQARPDAAFGDTPEFRTVNVPLVTLAVGAVVLLVAIPLWLLLTSAYAAVAAPRQRHETLLHLVGLPLGRARLLAGADATVLGAISGAAAAAVFPLVTHVVTSIPGTPAAWTPGQPSPTIPGVLLAVLAPALASLNASRRRPNRQRARPPRTRLAGLGRAPDLAPLAVLMAAIAAVLLTPDLRMDESPTSARIAVLLVGALALGAVIALPVLTRLLAASVLWPAARRVTTASSALWVACTRVARTPMPSGALGALAGIFVVAIAVVPLVAQVAPRDDTTADLNRKGNRVLVAIQTREPERTTAVLNRQPDVLGQWPATSVRGQMRFVMTCDDARLVLVETTCTPGSRIAPTRRRGGNDIGLDLGNILGAPWRIDVPATPKSPSRAARTASPGEPTLIAVRDTDAFWQLKSSAWDIDPLANVSAEYGGLIGGADQDYFVMQRWLSTALVVTLALAGVMALLGALDLARRLLTDIEPLRAVGLTRNALRGVVACAAALRAVTLGLIMSVTGIITASALTRWSNADPLTPGWTTLLVAVLVTVVTAMTLLPAAVATVGDPTTSE